MPWSVGQSRMSARSDYDAANTLGLSDHLVSPLVWHIDHMIVGLVTSYMSRADGMFLERPTHQLALKGTLVKVPFDIGKVTCRTKAHSSRSVAQRHLETPLDLLL
ncbi:hypothetical protein C8Q74DRAFT_519508 [Fomes fomentarius]|nr:hypothetical protein C8Q74DRAFT_519508 [Fomes fomentarius]